MNIKLKPKKKSEGAAFYFALLPESIQGSMGACSLLTSFPEALSRCLRGAM